MLAAAAGKLQPVEWIPEVCLEAFSGLAYACASGLSRACCVSAEQLVELAAQASVQQCHRDAQALWPWPAWLNVHVVKHNTVILLRPM